MELGDGFGKAAAALCAVAWSSAVILFRVSGRTVAPMSLNLFKNVLVLPFFFITLLALGLGAESMDMLWEVDPHVLIILLCSGALGIAVSESAYFAGLNLLGATRSSIAQTTYSPTIILFAWLMLGETLSWLGIAGAILIISSLFLATPRNAELKDIDGKTYLIGVAMAVLSVITLGLSLVPIRPILEAYNPVWTSTVRMIGGTAAMLLLVLASPQRRKHLAIFKPQKIWKVAIPAGIIGSYISMILFIAGFTYTQMNIASLLNQTATIMTITLAAIFLKERMNGRTLVATIAAVAGAVLVILESGS